MNLLDWLFILNVALKMLGFIDWSWGLVAWPLCADFLLYAVISLMGGQKRQKEVIQMREIKVQTGLRIPEKRYSELTELAAQAGVSVNSLILMLIDLGLSLRNGRVILHQESG